MDELILILKINSDQLTSLLKEVDTNFPYKIDDEYRDLLQIEEDYNSKPYVFLDNFCTGFKDLKNVEFNSLSILVKLSYTIKKAISLEGIENTESACYYNIVNTILIFSLIVKHHFILLISSLI